MGNVRKTICVCENQDLPFFIEMPNFKPNWELSTEEQYSPQEIGILDLGTIKLHIITTAGVVPKKDGIITGFTYLLPREPEILCQKCSQIM